MIPLRDNQLSRSAPLLTYTLIVLNCLIYLWDRQFNLFGSSVVFGDLSMRPEEIVYALQGKDSSFALVTLFTSLFLHGNLLHLIGNMLFLLTFGQGVEGAFGAPRFGLYYLAWGLVAWAAHIFVMPGSDIPTLGASGAIGGVLGAYFLLFPGNKIEVLIPFVFVPVVTSAWVLLGLWFLWQILVPQQGVANWAHAGGFMAGMATVLLLGGRAKILHGREEELDLDMF
ncbi:MAG TPA: rhomboid family intramembrane serine protease [Fimbriimonadaceae bacterium]|nr:rhomboid family intramembrane serine protease [Fimbriimonadaceae bacterium]